MSGNGQLTAIVQLVNTGGTIAVLLVVLWLGLRGDVVTAEQLQDCRQARDSYLREWVRAVTEPMPTPIPLEPSRSKPQP